jgi:hypothetical protein
VAPIVLVLFVYQAVNAEIKVPGSSNPWLAGMPSGSVASGDSAPAQSPVLVKTLPILQGTAFQFTVSGGVAIDPNFQPQGPEAGSPTSHNNGSENGISTITAPFNSLIGVFLGPNQPDLTAAPPGLMFDTGVSRSFAELFPLLKQTFFIGDGLIDPVSGTPQNFFVPSGATRLYLGTMDSTDWKNNIGSLSVTVVPEPVCCPFFVGAALMFSLRRRTGTWRRAEHLAGHLSQRGGIG